MTTEIETLQEIVNGKLKISQYNTEPSMEEYLFYTDNVDEWIETIKQNDIYSKHVEDTSPNDVSDVRVPELFALEAYHLNFDYEIIKNASGYITAPAFRYKSKTEGVTTLYSDSMQELKDLLLKTKYLLHLIIASVQTKTDEVDSFRVVDLGIPIVRYTFKGYILEEDSQ